MRSFVPFAWVLGKGNTFIQDEWRLLAPRRLPRESRGVARATQRLDAFCRLNNHMGILWYRSKNKY